MGDLQSQDVDEIFENDFPQTRVYIGGQKCYLVLYTCVLLCVLSTTLCLSVTSYSLVSAKRCRMMGPSETYSLQKAK